MEEGHNPEASFRRCKEGKGIAILDEEDVTGCRSRSKVLHSKVGGQGGVL